MNGILVINKAKNLSSYDVIRKVKKILNIKKVGHAGTLNPLATGLLIVLLGDATKLSNYIMDSSKTYISKIVLGESYDTEDCTGSLTEKTNVTEIKEVDKELSKLLDLELQTPPMYSALKKDGKKLYELARENKTIEREARKIEISEIKRTSEITYFENKASFTFLATVSKGTYIRTLCVDIGKALGYPAHMAELERIKSGPFTIGDSYTIEDLEGGNFKIMPLTSAFDNKIIMEASEEMCKKILNGVQLELNDNRELIVFTNKNNLIGIYRKNDGIYRAERVWN